MINGKLQKNRKCYIISIIWMGLAGILPHIRVPIREVALTVVNLKNI